MLNAGDILKLGGYTLRLENSAPLEASNYQGTRARFAVLDGQDDAIGYLEPETRQYAITRSVTSETSIKSSWRGDLYVVIGESAGGALAVRAYYTPMIGLIWTGFMLMGLGGFIATAPALSQNRSTSRASHPLR